MRGVRGEPEMAGNRRTIALWLCAASISALIVIDLFLLKQVEILRGQVWYNGPGAARAAIAAALATPLRSTGGGTVVVARTPYKYVLFFFFKPGDCLPCLQQLTEMNDLVARRPDVGVFAIAGYCSMDEAIQIASRYRPGFPILVDDGGNIIGALGDPLEGCC